jgi:hypothetical protein
MIKLFKKTALLLIILCLTIGFAQNCNAEISVKTQTNDTKTEIKQENTKNKSVRCQNCPANCLIKLNETGDCGQYKNVEGKLVPNKS